MKRKDGKKKKRERRGRKREEGMIFIAVCGHLTALAENFDFIFFTEKNLFPWPSTNPERV